MGDTLFLAINAAGGICHYRSLLPSRLLGLPLLSQDGNGKIDYCDPSITGSEKFKLAIIQMPGQEFQFRQILKLKSEGTIVVANIDDWVPTIGKLGDDRHGFSTSIRKNNTEWFLKSLGVVDGFFCSTPWLQSKLASYGKPTWLCRNGLDLERYDYPKPLNDTGVLIGWAGGTGHWGALHGVKDALNEVLFDNPNAHFVSVGDQAYEILDAGLADRLHQIDWQDLWMYPRDMAMFDIAIAPAEVNDFYRAKSQLRFYEAGAVGACPVVAPMYDEVVDGVTGFIARSSDDWYDILNNVVRDHDLRRSVADAAKDYVWSSCGIDNRRAEWETAINEAKSLRD